MAVAAKRLVIPPGEGDAIDMGGVGVQFKLRSADTNGSVAIVEHPVAPKRLVPPHTHQREDELSYVLSGRVMARIGDETFDAPAGSYIFKPRGVPHTFWNPDDAPARLLEIIVPGGFEQYFLEIMDLVKRGATPGGPEHAELGRRYGHAPSFEWVPELKTKYGLKVTGEK